MKVGQSILYLLTYQETPIDGLVWTLTFWYQFQNLNSEEKDKCISAHQNFLYSLCYQKDDVQKKI